MENLHRIRDDNREENPRKKRKSDSGELMKERNEKRKQKEVPTISGTLKFYVKTEQMKIKTYNKIDRVKLLLGEKISNVSNYDVLNELCDFYLNSGKPRNEAGEQSNSDEITHHPYLMCSREETNEEFCLCSTSALRNICAGIQKHHIECGKLCDIKESKLIGHVAKVTFQCEEGHTFKSDTSPHIEGGKFLANLRMINAVFSTGLRYSEYCRLCKAAGIGICAESNFETLHETFCSATDDVFTESVTNAIQEETALSILEMDDIDNFKGIDILTDARHGWRRNAAQSDVIAIGARTNKVVGAITVTREDEPCSQKHEMLGVVRLYNHFDENDTSINMHGHDRNSSVNKFLATEKIDVTNANDMWHATKNISREIKKITKGPSRDHGIKWHSELSDKAGSVRTHCYYAIKNCNGSVQRLQKILDNTVEHYKNNHENCLPESRCKWQENYENSKTIIKSPKAVKLLTEAIKSLQIYKTPADYVHCIATHYVECFNNAALVYQDKRIAFGHKEYKRRTKLAVLDWNENINRDYTSVTMYEDPRFPRRQSGHKNLKPKTFNFVNEIWDKVLNNYYTN